MQFSTNHSGLQNTYCTAINSSNDSLTLNNFNVASGIIYQVFFTKLYISNIALELPPEIEAQEIYFLRMSSSLIKVYETLADAQAQTNAINFATTASGNLFSVYFPIETYPPLTCWHPGAAEIENISCCPPVPEVFTNCPNEASVTYKGESRTLKMYSTVNYYGSLNTNYFMAGEFDDGFGHTFNLYAQIAFYFKDYSDGTNYPKPAAVINLFGSYGTGFGQGFAGTATYTTTGNYSTNITLDLVSNTLSSYVTRLTNQGFLPASLTFNLSGQITPPPQIKVFMPDSYFDHKDKPINIGQIEEVLTYDSNTLTYWSDVLTYAGIKGRLHFAIPNFYPLASSGIEFINYGVAGNYQKFPNAMLNTYSNDEFYFYKTIEIIRPLENTNYYQPAQNNLILFTASDFYNGYPNEDYLTFSNDVINQAKSYPTGLPLNSTWFHTSVVRNYDPNDPYVLGLTPEFVIRKPTSLAIAFSKWASGKFNKGNVEVPNNLNQIDHYKQNFFMVKSVHPEAHITSLGL